MHMHVLVNNNFNGRYVSVELNQLMYVRIMKNKERESARAREREHDFVHVLKYFKGR